MAESTVLSSSSSDRIYQSSRRHPRTYSHILFQKTIFQRYLGPFRGTAGSKRTFSNSSPRATYPRIFSLLSKPIYARGEAVEPNLQRHHYAPTSNVTLQNHLHPIKSSALTTFSTHLIFLLYHSFTKALTFKHFWSLSCGPRGSTPPFSDPTYRATYPTNFSRLSTSIYAPAKRWSLTCNVTLTSICSSIYRGDQPVS